MAARLSRIEKYRLLVVFCFLRVTSVPAPTHRVREHAALATHYVRFTEMIWDRHRLNQMAKPKRKLTAAERRAKKERKKKYQLIFTNGKQVRVKRPETIDGMEVDEYIARNADPIWLAQNEMWEYIQPD